MMKQWKVGDIILKFNVDQSIADRKVLVIDATEYEGIIATKDVVAMCKEYGLRPCDVTDLRLQGGIYARECFAARVWVESKRRRGDSSEGEEFANAFDHVKTIELQKVEKLYPHVFVFNNALDNVKIDEESLVNVKGTQFDFCCIENFEAPISEDRLNEIGGIHLEIANKKLAVSKQKM